MTPSWPRFMKQLYCVRFQRRKTMQMTKVSKKVCVGIAALMLLSVAGIVAGQQSLEGCPAITVHRSVAETIGGMTTERLVADKMIAEAQLAMRTPSGENVAKAISLFEKAIRIDPKNATAYVFLARAHLQSQRYMSVPKKTARARA